MRTYYYYIFIPLLVFLLLPLSGCGKHQKGTEEASEVLKSDSIPREVKDVVKAISDNDSDGFAKLVSYPLARPYPLEDIKNEDEMKHYYSKMVDDSMRNVVTKSKVHDWEPVGWRGWTVDNGEYVWIDSLVYDVNYVSPEEMKERKKLMDSEIATLPENLRKGDWTPETCLKVVDRKRIARIDSHKEESADTSVYRMAIFDSIAPQRLHPTAVMRGYKTFEGSAGTIYYIFTDGKGTQAVYEEDLPDSPGAVIIFTRPDNTVEEVEVEKTYWRKWVTSPEQIESADSTKGKSLTIHHHRH